MTKRQIDRILTMVPQIATMILATIVLATFLGATGKSPPATPTPIVWHTSTPAEQLACERQHLADALSEARSQWEGRPYNSLKPC